MNRLKKLSAQWSADPRVAYGLAALGALVYAIQSFVYIFTSRSMLDEGLYLVKGWYFATGQYTPFQDYGPLTNQMPLSFLIPGFLLRIFGANLLTGRLYAVVLSLAMVAVIWFLARRFGGLWWAAFAIWALALNVAQVRIYSLALSQVLIVALVAGILWLSLRRTLSLGQVAAAGVLAAVMVLVRINMLPFAILWLLYLWWQHGAKTLGTAIAGFAVPMVLVHALYWPNILRLWAYWIPQGWIPSLAPFYTPWDKYTGMQFTSNWGWLTNLDDSSWDPIISFWQGMRFNFVVMTGVLLNLLLWPGRKAWPDTHKFRMAIFLNVSFIVLLLVHMWAALGGQSCTAFCFSGYIAFFSAIGLLAIAVTAPHWRRQLHWAHQVLLGTVLVIFCAGIGFGAADKIGKFLAELPVPRLSGSAPLWGYFENKFGTSLRDARKIIPAIAGFAAGVALLIAAIPIGHWKPAKGFSLAARALLVFFILGYVLAPTPLLSGGDETLTCGGNLIAAYREVGAQLAPLMSAGEKLYYRGPNSPAILLYLPRVEIYPPQLNNVFSFSLEEDGPAADTLLRFGYWNQELKDRWMAEADVVLIEDRQYEEWAPLVEAGELDTVFVSEPLEPCRGKDSSLILLRRAQENSFLP